MITCLRCCSRISWFSPVTLRHLERLVTVFLKLGECGLKLKPSKCHLVKQDVQFLGHVISAKGVRVSEGKNTVVRDWPTPKCPIDIHLALGFISYYWKCVPNFYWIAALLYGLEGKPKKNKEALPFQWDVFALVSRRSTNSKKLTTAPILAYLNFIEPFILTRDASFNGLGAVLSQHQHGVEKVLTYASRGHHRSERNVKHYSAFKPLALKWNVTDTFREYQLHSKFVAYTDHNHFKYRQC